MRHLPLMLAGLIGSVVVTIGVDVVLVVTRASTNACPVVFFSFGVTTMMFSTNNPTFSRSVGIVLTGARRNH